MSEVRASARPTPLETPKANPRIDLLSLAVRFQSLIGLVLVVIGGVIFSPVRHGHILFLAPDNIANIIRGYGHFYMLSRGRHAMTAQTAYRVMFEPWRSW